MPKKSKIKAGSRGESTKLRPHQISELQSKKIHLLKRKKEVETTIGKYGRTFDRDKVLKVINAELETLKPIRLPKNWNK